MSLCREKSSVLDNLRPIHRSHYLWQSIEPFNTTKLNKGKKTTEHTAAIDGEESSPGWGCVTSAPNIIVGRSVTRGIFLCKASFNTVLRPSTCKGFTSQFKN